MPIGESIGEPARDGFAGGSATCAVKLPSFEGPLDLLLHLCRANEVDVSDIPIALISEQYLQYLELMRQLDIDIAGEYLLMAATLAHIKSRLLLPPSEEDVDEDEEDPRAELARRLAAFAAYREASEDLARRPFLGRDVFVGAPLQADVPAREPVLHVSLNALVAAMRRVLAQTSVEELRHAVVRERVTLQERLLAVMDALQESGGKPLLFEDILTEAAPSRAWIVMTFLAILELARRQVLRIYQHVTETGLPEGPIRVRAAALDEDVVELAPAPPELNQSDGPDAAEEANASAGEPPAGVRRPGADEEEPQ